MGETPLHLYCVILIFLLVCGASTIRSLQPIRRRLGAEKFLLVCIVSSFSATIVKYVAVFFVLPSGIRANYLSCNSVILFLVIKHSPKLPFTIIVLLFVKLSFAFQGYIRFVSLNVTFRSYFSEFLCYFIYKARCDIECIQDPRLSPAQKVELEGEIEAEV